MADSKNKIIEGETFLITQPYDEGHVLSAAEARALNQLRGENIGNNLRKQIKDAKEKGDTSNIADLVAKYDAEYSFALPGQSTPRSTDPVERECRALAKDYIKTQLAAQGRKLSDVPAAISAQYPDNAEAAKQAWEDKLEANIAKVMADESTIKLAKQRVAAKKKAAENTVAELDL